MKGIKKILSLLLVLVFAMTAFSCAKTEAPAETTAADRTAADTTAEPADEPEYETVKEILPEYDVSVTEPTNPLKIYVAAGADAASSDGSEAHPFATLEAARDAARTVDKTGHDSVDIVITGSFFRTETFTLSKEDSGTAECRIRYVGDGNTLITGGVTIPSSDFAPVSDSEYLSCFDDTVEGNILTVDLKKYGVTPEDVASADNCPYPAEGMNTPFLGETRLHVARYPDGKYISLGNIEKLGDEDNATYSIKYTEIHNTHIEKWHDLENVFVTGYFTYYWYADQAKVLSFNMEDATMLISDPKGYEPQKGMSYYWYNIPEELTEEGEYYITKDAVLYFYPTEAEKNENLYFPISRSYMIRSQASYVTFTGINFEDNVNYVGDFEGDGVDFIGNSVRRMGASALKFKGSDCRILNCEIEHIADACIAITGGNGGELEMSNNVAADNRILYYSERMRTYNGAFKVDGCGNTVTNNEIAHANHLAFLYSGVCNLFQYNEVYDVLRYTDDAGVIYSGRTLQNYGNVIRYNYFHDLGSPSLMLCATIGVYYDDGLSGQIAYGNIIENIAGTGFGIGGGSDNYVHDNLVINSGKAVGLDQRYYDQTKVGEPGHNLYELAQEFFGKHPKYTETFPTVTRINDSKDLEDPWYWAAPARNVIVNNYAFTLEGNPMGNGGEPFVFADAVTKYSTVENNVNTYYEEGSQPTVEEALEATGLEIPFDMIGVGDK